MKNPLNYQLTEYDCGPTTMLNAINFLFEREEIPPDVIKFIMLYCLDAYNEAGEACKSGTTCMAMRFLANWLGHYGEVKKWSIFCDVISGESVTMSQNSKIAECLQLGGVAVARVMLDCWHYVLLTGMDSKQVYLFDPYYREIPFQKKGIEVVNNEPKSWNRRVDYDILNSEGNGDYAMGEIKIRECVLIYNRMSKKSIDNIEYMI